MMAKRRLVVGKAIDDVKAADLEPLVAYVEDPNPSTCLLLIADKVDVRLKAFSALRKRGYLHVFAPLRDNALAGWLRTEAKSRGIDIKPDAANALAMLAGPDLGRLAQALEQLAIYVGRERAVTVDDVEDLVAETREHAIFELTKAIGMGDVPRALALCANMLRNREPPLKIQFMLVRQVRQIWRAKELAAAGASRGDIAAARRHQPLLPGRRAHARQADVARRAGARARTPVPGRPGGEDIARGARARAVAPRAGPRGSALGRRPVTPTLSPLRGAREVRECRSPRPAKRGEG